MLTMGGGYLVWVGRGLRTQYVYCVGSMLISVRSVDRLVLQRVHLLHSIHSILVWYTIYSVMLTIVYHSKCCANDKWHYSWIYPSGSTEHNRALC